MCIDDKVSGGERMERTSFYLKVKRLREDAKINPPAKAGDAGYDVYAYPHTDLRLYTGERYKVPLGIALEFPEGYVCIVQQKSGLAHGFGIDTIGNVIDAGYRGEIHATVVNHGKEPLVITYGQKIAQLVFHSVETADIEFVDTLSETERGATGFGSTGLK